MTDLTLREATWRAETAQKAGEWDKAARLSRQIKRMIRRDKLAAELHRVEAEIHAIEQEAE